MPIFNNALAGAAGSGGAAGYEIERSLRFNSADSSYLSFQPSSAGNRRTWTWAGWVKRSGLTDTYPTIFGAGTGGNSEASIRFNSNGTLEYYMWTGGYNARLLTTQVFRDTSAWYHLVAVFDTTNATASNRIRLYINGSEVTTFSSRTDPGLNYEGYVNNSISHTIGDAAPGASPRFFNGYLADVHFIDGQALAPTDFGEFDDNGVWQPKAVSITSPNDGTNWASSNYLSSTSHYSTYVVGNGFDGDENSQWLQATQGGSVTFSGISIPYTSSVEIKLGGTGGTVSVNGGTGQSLGANSWNTIASGAGTLTSLSWQANGSEYPALFGIKIDGVLLVANAGTYGTNGFHLDFSDNSSNAALGNDSSGNNNDWTVNNLVGSTVFYRNQVSVSGSYNSSTQKADKLFDGRLDTLCLPSEPSSVVTWTPSGLGSVSSLEIYGGGNSGSTTFLVSVNGSSVANNDILGSGGSAQWRTIPSSYYSGGLTTLSWGRASGQGINMAAIRVNGIELIDSDYTDSSVDSPTNGTQTDTGAGNEVVGNYATLNPLDNPYSIVLSNGNLDWEIAGTAFRSMRSNFMMTSGKWYFETRWNTGAPMMGIARPSDTMSSHLGASTNFGIGSSSNATYKDGSQNTSGVPSHSPGDILMCAFDADAGKVWFGANGSWYSSGDPAAGTNERYSGLTDGTWMPAVTAYNSSGNPASINFGQRPFAYTAPSGFKALCTANLPDPTIADGSTAMDALLFTGNGGSQTLSGLGFSPDFTWFKTRSVPFSHELLDIVRGGTKVSFADLTNAESTNGSLVTSFNSDGVSIGSALGANGSSRSSVLWAWDAGTSTVSNTDGSITSTVRANPSAGFSVVGYNGGSGTVGHGLGIAPKLIIVKNRTSSTDPWVVYHESLGNTQIIYLNYTNAAGTFPMWNNTSPTSTVFSVGSNGNVSGNCIAYCFAPVDGYSSFGSYVGNGSSDGPMVYTGFRPRWLMIKSVNYADNWLILDAARETFNVMNTNLSPNSSGAETVATNDAFDFVSNGFKIRGGGAVINTNNAPFIYACFSEHPFKTARAR